LKNDVRHIRTGASIRHFAVGCDLSATGLNPNLKTCARAHTVQPSASKVTERNIAERAQLIVDTEQSRPH